MEGLQALVWAWLGPSPHESKFTATPRAFEVLFAACQGGELISCLSPPVATLGRAGGRGRFFMAVFRDERACIHHDLGY